MGAGYKVEAGDPHHPLPPQQAPIPQQIQHPRPINIAHPQSHPNSPHQNQHSGAFRSPRSTNHSVPLQHQPPYAPPAGPNSHIPPEYYTTNPYDAPVPGSYSSAEGSDIMAAVRPYQNVYHTPQSNSPASVASSQGHEQHARMYAQPPPQMQQNMYAYPQYQVPPNAYTQQQPQQHQMMSSQSLTPHQQGPPPMPHQSPAQQQPINSPRPQTKLEPGTIPRPPMDPATLQRSPTGQMNPNQSTPSGPAANANGLHTGTPGGTGVNPNAAPGPIPATTPLVVRQDNNGVQWIAFEYSRDRVKMEYTIRCDVESVNTDNLSTDFRSENCVYPRACAGKDGYRGNRFQYEMECNTVGWALAELNPCLRGKRGLIQRAVDSWRNSNQDARLRSRRVRRMAKTNARNKSSSHPPNHMAGPRDVGAPPSSATPMPAPGQQRPPPSNISMANQAQLHHHHANPDGSHPGSTDDVSVNNDFDSHQRQQPSNPATTIRQSNVFNPSYPLPPYAGGASITPTLHNALEMGGPHTTVSASTTIHPTRGSNSPLSPQAPGSPDNDDPLCRIPEGKKRKFVVINDLYNNNKGIRVKFDLQSVPIHEAPDSYRKINSVYPRSWYPTQMQLSPKSRGARGRFLRAREDDVLENAEGANMEVDGKEQVGTVMVQMPMLEGEAELKVPGLGRRARAREEKLNDLGYRMSWSQSKSFAWRVLFLQRGLDKYRNEMKKTLLAGGQDVSTVAPFFETRVGKHMWLEARGKGRKRDASP